MVALKRWQTIGEFLVADSVSKSPAETSGVEQQQASEEDEPQAGAWWRNTNLGAPSRKAHQYSFFSASQKCVKKWSSTH